MKHLRTFLAALLLVCLTISSTAFADPTEAVTLADWAGTWNNYAGFFDQADFLNAAKAHLKDSDKKLEDVLTPYREMMKADFQAMTIDGDTITMLDDFSMEKGNVVSQSAYAFVQAHTTMYGEFEVVWYEFKATGESKYPVMLMTPPHGHGDEGMIHFHFRYGDDVQQLLAKENEEWYPTFVVNTTTVDQLVDELFHHDEHEEHNDHDHDHDHKHD